MEDKVRAGARFDAHSNPLHRGRLAGLENPKDIRSALPPHRMNDVR